MSLQSDSTFGYALGAYDPLGGAIRLTYDVARLQDLLANPSIVHELTHYGQTFLTQLGSDYALMLNELYVATYHILRSQAKLRLPLASMPSSERVSKWWENAEFARCYLHEVIGGLDSLRLLNFSRAMKRHHQDLFSAIRSIGGTNPIWLTGIAEEEPVPRPLHRIVFEADGSAAGRIIPASAYRLPTLEVAFPKGQRLSFSLDGSFVLELHARTVEFLQYSSDLGGGEQIEYFLFSQNDPYFLPTLAVSRLVVQRLGKSIFGVPDAILLCHLCCVIALNWTSHKTAKVRMQEIGTQHIRLRYVPPGQLFANALSAALEHLTEPGEAVTRYFSLFRNVVRTMGAPSLEEIADNMIDEARRRASSCGQVSANSHDEFIQNRWMAMQRAVRWWKRSFQEEDLHNFILGHLELLRTRTLPSPLFLGPERLSPIWGSPSRSHVRAMLNSFLTRKLWADTDLTCLETADQPYEGSVVGCSQESVCLKNRSAKRIEDICSNHVWKRFLGQYGLTSEVLQDLQLG
jgi:hypothetical protein